MSAEFEPFPILTDNHLITKSSIPQRKTHGIAVKIAFSGFKILKILNAFFIKKIFIGSYVLLRVTVGHRRLSLTS